MSRINDIIRELEYVIVATGTPDDKATEGFRPRIEHEIDSLISSLAKRDVGASSNWLRPREQELLRKYLSRAIKSRCVAVRPVYNHLLITAADDDFASSRVFAERLCAASAEFFGDPREEYVRSISEEDFYSFGDEKNARTLSERLGTCRCILIPEFHAADLAKFETALEALGIGLRSVVICSTEDAEVKLNNYSNRDYRLSRFLLKNRFYYTKATPRDIYEFTCRQLEESGLALTDGFRAKLERYVDAVYPDAVFQGAQFVRDLLIRIEDTRAEALRFSATLTAEDVPYSRKAEQQASEPAAEKEPEPAPQAKPAEKPVSEAVEITNEEFAKLTFAKDNGEGVSYTQADSSGRRTNVLLLAMSTFPPKNTLNCYDFEDRETGNHYNGRGQLDPVPKKLAADLNMKLDKIIILRTDATKGNADIIAEAGSERYSIKQVSPVEFFKAQIDGYTCGFEEVEVKQGKPDEALKGVVDNIRAMANDNENGVDLYIDIHGGLRDTQMITQSVISLLETDAATINTKVLTVVNNHPEHYITSGDETMRVQSFVSGITELLNYGRTASLHRYFDSNSKNKGINKVLRHLDKIANGILWCDVNGFEEGLKNLGGFHWEELKGVSYLPLFEQNIKNGFSNLLEEHTLVDEIRWCLDKGFYQQALALIESKIPKEFLNRGKFTIEYKMSNQPDKKYNSNESDMVNSVLFDAYSYFVNRNISYNQNRKIWDIFKSGKLNNQFDEIGKLPNLTTEMKKSDEGKTKLKLRAEDEGSISSYSCKFNVDCSPKKLTLFLMLHGGIKSIRNDSMHTKEFKYTQDSLLNILNNYLALGEEILYGTAK